MKIVDIGQTVHLKRIDAERMVEAYDENHGHITNSQSVPWKKMGVKQIVEVESATENDGSLTYIRSAKKKVKKIMDVGQTITREKK